MTENFKASEVDNLFGVHSVKTPFSGAYYKEINDRCQTAIKSQSKIQIIIRGLDADYLLTGKDEARYDTYPDYLYDNSVFNDVYYLLNKKVLFEETLFTIEYSQKQLGTTDFDTYSNWMEGQTFGKDAVLGQYERCSEKSEIIEELDTTRVLENIQQNITALVEQYPAIEFYFFIPPYSIVKFDDWNQAGYLTAYLQAMRLEIETLVQYKNVHLFAFFDETELTCNLDNYKDAGHYGEWINSKILQWMAEGKHQLTTENYEVYCDFVEDFYANYDYDALFVN
jgi:hypothetical protein